MNSEFRQSAIETLRLLSLEEAARILGYTTKGLRKIVERTRAKASGEITRGPTIRFFQATKGAPIKFKPEWIEQFIVAHTVSPPDLNKVSVERVAARPVVDDTAGLDRGFLDLGH